VNDFGGPCRQVWLRSCDWLCTICKRQRSHDRYILAGCSLRRRTNGSYREYCKAEYVEADRQLWAEHVDFGLDRRKGRIAVVSSFQLDSIAPSRAAIRPAKDWMQSATLTLRTLKQIGPLLAAKLAVSHISPAILIGTSFHRS